MNAGLFKSSVFEDVTNIEDVVSKRCNEILKFKCVRFRFPIFLFVELSMLDCVFFDNEFGFYANIVPWLQKSRIRNLDEKNMREIMFYAISFWHSRPVFGTVHQVVEYNSENQSEHQSDNNSENYSATF